MKFIQIYSLKIYTAEDVLCGDRPFYKALLAEARKHNLAGGTVIHATEGYGTEMRGIGKRAMPVFFSGSYNLPVIVEIVDSKEKLEALYPFLEANGEKHFLAVITKRNCLYTKYIQENGEKMGRDTVSGGESLIYDEPVFW